MIVLLIVGLAGAAGVLYALDRLLKARSYARRRRAMSVRLAAATVRAEEQHEQRQAGARASAELTSVMPAIERPPLTLPSAAHQGHPAGSL
jgi:3-polyprenyl-4-hydroxybenzoate decarboxylase